VVTNDITLPQVSWKSVNYFKSWNGHTKARARIHTAWRSHKHTFFFYGRKVVSKENFVGFRRHESTTDRYSPFVKTSQRKWNCSGKVHLQFMNSKKACNSGENFSRTQHFRWIWRRRLVNLIRLINIPLNNPYKSMQVITESYVGFKFKYLYTPLKEILTSIGNAIRSFSSHERINHII
jgi:hypothetical protein